jgi:hypothetical protein|tara:strand:- start:1249 stop:1386 length:138 start_codon:yes stop_codon:yes gene_type:complete
MWKIKYTEEGKTKTFESDVEGGILSAIEDFYSKFKWKSIISVEWV